MDLLVFDLDGTLVRSGEDLVAAVNHTLQSLGFSLLEPDTVQGFVGDGLEALINRALGPNDGEYHERTVVIGDGVNDILLARQAGALSCAFLSGITGRDKLLSLAPDMTCETLSAVVTLLG